MAVEPSAGEVVGRRRWTDDLFSIRIRADFEPFEPGQFARIGLNIGGENVLRPYSFVNAPNEEAHEFYYGIVPGGPLSARLVELQPGDSILYVPKPNGYMVLSEVPEARHLWMLATGTAVGPFVSILKNELVWQRFEKIALAHAVRHAAELAYGDEIQQFLQKGQGAVFLRAVCQPGGNRFCIFRTGARRIAVGRIAGAGGDGGVARRVAGDDLRQSANGQGHAGSFANDGAGAQPPPQARPCDNGKLLVRRG